MILDRENLNQYRRSDQDVPRAGAVSGVTALANE